MIMQTLSAGETKHISEDDADFILLYNFKLPEMKCEKLQS